MIGVFGFQMFFNHFEMCCALWLLFCIFNFLLILVCLVTRMCHRIFVVFPLDIVQQLIGLGKNIFRFLFASMST